MCEWEWQREQVEVSATCDYLGERTRREREGGGGVEMCWEAWVKEGRERERKGVRSGQQGMREGQKGVGCFNLGREME